jgi:hypothetical protein
MLFQTQPNLLSIMLKKVRNQHPVRRGQIIGPEKSIVDEVRNLLGQTKPEHLKNLSFQFDSTRLLACVDIVATDREGDTAEKAIQVAILRPRDPMLTRVWLKLVVTYPNPLLETLIRNLIVIKGYASLEKQHRISNHLPQWFLSSELTDGILRDYRSVSENVTLDSFLVDHFFTTDHALYNAVWLKLLINGTAKDLRRQWPGRILVEMENCPKASDRRSIGRNYLNTLDGMKDWDKDILEYILKNWGNPGTSFDDKKIEHRFWHSVNDSAKEEFRRWMMLREVESFFEGVRAEFWRAFVNSGKIKDVNKILNGEGFMLDFGRFGVIEFKNVGNAAYVYPSITFREFWNKADLWTNKPSYFFKERSKTLRSKTMPGWDGRILHPTGWRYTAKERINLLTNEK